MNEKPGRRTRAIYALRATRLPGKWTLHSGPQWRLKPAVLYSLWRTWTHRGIKKAGRFARLDAIWPGAWGKNAAIIKIATADDQSASLLFIQINVNTAPYSQALAIHRQSAGQDKKLIKYPLGKRSNASTMCAFCRQPV